MSSVQRPSQATNHDLISENPIVESPSIVSGRTENQEVSVGSAIATFNETREVTQVPIAEITLNPRLHMREALRADVVDEYAEFVFDLPPVKIVRLADGTMLLTDGWYRYHAHKKAEQKEMLCYVRDGTFLDALLEAMAKNAAHGIQRTVGHKRRAVMLILSEPQLADWSDRRIAEHCHLNHQFVGVVRKEWTAAQRDNDESDSGGGSATGETAEEPKRTGRDGKRQSATKKKKVDE